MRQPAALCGVVGLKPTYGRVSRYGLIAFASSLDQVGPLAKDVRDAALLLETIAGADPLDSTAASEPVGDYQAALGRGVEGLTLGIPDEYFVAGLDPEVEHAVRAAIRVLERSGARTRRVSLPHTDAGVATYYIVAPAEASSNLARYDGVKYGLRVGRRAGPRLHDRGHARGGLRPGGAAPRSCWAPTCCRPATTRPTTRRPSASAR